MSHLKRGADGHLLKNAARHLVKRCCSAICGYCDDLYCHYEVTFSGISVCTDCLNRTGGGAGSGQVTIAPTIHNDTFVIEYISSCYWATLSETGNYGQTKHYSVVDCADSATTRTLTNLRVALQRTSNTEWKLSAAYLAGGPYPLWVWPDTELIIVPSKDCGSVAANHPWASCADNYEDNGKLYAGYGGSVTITPL